MAPVEALSASFVAVISPYGATTQSLQYLLQYFANFCGSRFVGHGLFSLINRREHRQRRLFLNPAFHKTALMSLICEFNSSTATLIQKLNKICNEAGSSANGVVVNLSDFLGKITLDVIAKVAFGLDLNTGNAGRFLKGNGSHGAERKVK